MKNERPRQNARLPAFVRPRAEPAAALQASHVGIIGAGAIGLPLARGLASLVPNAADVVDPKSTKSQSLDTHGIGPEQVGMPKARLAADTMGAISPTTATTAFPVDIADLDPSVLAAWDFAFLATDNLDAEVRAGQRCMNYGIPLVHASVDGDTLFAQVRFFGNREAAGPCPACLFSGREWQLHSEAVQFSCDGSAHTIAERPTRSTASLCTMASSLALNVYVRHVVGLGPDRRDQVIEYAGYTDSMIVSPLARNPQCPCDHDLFRDVPDMGYTTDLRLRDIAALAGVVDPAAFAATQFGAEGRRWVSRVHCPTCGWGSMPDRFVPAVKADRLSCTSCGEDAPPCHLFTQPWVSGRQLMDAADARVRELCGSCPSAFIVRPPDGPSLRFKLIEDET